MTNKPANTTTSLDAVGTDGCKASVETYKRGSEPIVEINLNDDPGHCPYCNAEFEMVRPGKSQPTCTCQDPVDKPASETPRLEAFRDTCGDYEKPHKYISRLHDFARRLERELTQSQTELAKVKAENVELRKERDDFYLNPKIELSPKGYTEAK
jgi:hypothetical protein